MKSRTSFFNSAVFRKNTTRFAPVWVLYGLFLLLVLGGLVDDSHDAISLAADLASSLMPFAALNAFYALLCAQLVFGDLFQSRMCNALHAMPMRRECWFFTNALSGLWFYLLPTAVMAGLVLLFLRQYLYIALLWLLGMLAQYLFFYGVAVFSVFCVGNRFAMVLVDGIVNFLSLLAGWLLYAFYEPLLYGIEVNFEAFLNACPLFYFSTTGLVEMVHQPQLGLSIVQSNLSYYGIGAVVGLLFFGFALLLYRKRALECAGDFMAVKHLAPVFLLLYTLCAGAALYLFNQLFFGDGTLVFLLLGLVIGFFTGKMLLNRTLQVFSRRAFLQLGALLGVFILTVVLTWADPLGITRWVPKPSHVAQVTISENSLQGDRVLTLTDPALIQDAVSIHQHGIEHRDEGVNGKPDVKVYLTYTLKSGFTLQRYYYVDVATPAGQQLRKYLSTPDCVLGLGYDIGSLNALSYIELGGAEARIVDPQQMQALLAALVMDCQAGNTAQSGNFHQGEDPVEWLYLATEDDGRILHYRPVTIWESCENTVRWLETQGLTSKKLP